MEENDKIRFSLKNRFLSFRYAFNGLKTLFTQEHNARIHFVIAILTIAIGMVLNISPIEWLIILILIALVFCLEIINTAIEYLCNFISPEWHKAVKDIKDLSAAAVLVAAIISIICGIIIFAPKLCDFLAYFTTNISK